MLPGHNKFGYIKRKPVTSPSAMKKSPLNKIRPLNRIDKCRAAASPLRNDAKQNTQEQQSRKRKANNELNSCSKNALLSNPGCDENNITLDSENSKRCTVFRNWQLLITVKGQLAIEGTVKCGITLRSYEIIKRFTNTKVQSVYKHIYILDGSLVDERRELPEYVRRKFHNGFPDDWENVYQLWNKYIDTSNAGLKVRFRWPPITDSDIHQQSELCSSSKKTFNSSITCDEKNINFNKFDSTEIKGCKVFSRWRVLINDEGQLIIKGTLQCGRIARSKPVIQRFSNKKVLSISKWIYILDGTLVNENNDVPDYVRWKFHNGFPVDWENVYRHWKNYLAKR